MKICSTRLLLSHLGLTLIIGSGLTGCSVLEESKVNYQSAKQVNSLEIPPDLTQMSADNRFVLGSGPISATDLSSSTQQSGTHKTTASNQVGDVRLERAGNQRWLVVSRPPEALWETLRQFWTDSGFKLQVEQANLGIMETDWAENRSNIPQDIVRRTLGRVFDSLYDSGLRDRFRTRLERTAQGHTEIYISHRGMEEVYTAQNKDRTVWQARASNPDLEAEFLRRLMLKLGATEAQSKTENTRPAQAQVLELGSELVVALQNDMERAWRRLGLALDRTGFTVEDRDRPQGIYFVRYVDILSEAEKPGFFGRIFSSKAEKSPMKLRIQLRDQGSGTVHIHVLDEHGKTAPSTTAQGITKLLVEELR